MKSCFPFLLAASLAPLSAQTSLIGPTLRNGGFEDFDGSDFASTPYWDSYFPEGAGEDPVLATNPNNGLLRSFASGYQLTGNRIHPSQTIPVTNWDIREGDVITVAVSARSGFGFDLGSDQLQAILHVVDAGAAAVTDSQSPTGHTDRLISSERELTAAAIYESFVFTSQPVRAGSPWIGNGIRLRFLNTGDRDEYVILDDVSLTGYRSDDLEADPELLASYPADGDATDSGPNGSDGIADPGLSYGPGFGIGRSFATAAGGVSAPLGLPSSFSFAFWIKADTPGGTGNSYQWHEGSALIDGSGSGIAECGVSLRGEQVAFGCAGKTLFSRSLVTDSRWHHVAVTREHLTGSMQLFVDGDLQDLGSAPAAGPLAPDLHFGAARGGGRPFDGMIDDIRIFSGILGPEDIDSIRIGSGDTDGDGFPDSDEVEAGTDWGSAADFPRVDSTALTMEGFKVGVDGRKSREYELHLLDSLEPGHSTSVVDSVEPLATDSPVELTDPTPTGDKAFYQVAASMGTPPRPNILMIVGDDHGYADISAFPNARPDISTPHLDRIAAAGVRFTQAYVTGPVCSPSRAGFLTGRYQQEWDADAGWGPGLPAGVTHLAEYLSAAGYNTAMIGKSDFGKNLFYPAQREYPANHGFAGFFGFSAHAHDFFLHSQAITDSTTPAWPGEASAHLGKFLSSSSPTNFETLTDGTWQTEEFTDRAIGYLESRAGESDPFFLYLSHASVHALIHQAPKAYLDVEGVPELPLYDPATNTTDNPASYNDYYYNYSRPAPVGPISDGDMRKYYRAHLAAYDDQIGRLLDSLQSTGLGDNTIVIYFSDNGGEALNGANNQPLSGSKYNMFEGGIRVPMMISWPGRFSAGQAYDHVVSTLDLAPTLLQAAFIDNTPQLRGFPITRAVVEDRPVLNQPRTLFWRFNTFWAVRHGDWKLVFSNKGISNATSQIVFNNAALGKIALFNLAADPSEMNDLADDPDPAIQAIRTDLQARFDAWEASH